MLVSRAAGVKSTKYQAVQVPAAYTHDLAGSLRRFATSASAQAVQRPGWLSAWLGRSDAAPSFAASAVFGKGAVAQKAAHSAAAAATGGPAAGGESSSARLAPAALAAVRKNPLFRFASMGIDKDAGAAAPKPEPELRTTLGRLAERGPKPVPSAKAPSKKRLRSALLAYATM